MRTAHPDHLSAEKTAMLRHVFANGLAGVLGIFLLVVLPDAAQGQDNRILTLDDHRYTLIQRLQTRGHLLDLHPTAQPYTYDLLDRAIAALDWTALSPLEQRWVRAIQDVQAPDTTSALTVYGEWRGGFSVANTKRLEVERPLERASQPFYQRLQLQFAMTVRGWVAQIAGVHDGYYDRDPDSFDTALRLKIRTENAYLGYARNPFAIYFGRYHVHWGQHDQTALLVSKNPRAYDHVTFQLGGKKLSFRSMFAELDAITEDGRYTGQAAADTVQVGFKRRFLVAHRLDYRPSPRVALTLMESVLYSSVSSGLSLRYLNPLHVMVVGNNETPKNDENNALLGAMVWLYFNRTTVHGQIVLDDIDLQSLTREGASFSALLTVHHALAQQPLDLQVEAEAVASRTYNTHQPEGQYLYLLRGIGTQYNDYVRLSVKGNWYADRLLKGLVVSPVVTVLAQGAAQITDPFPSNDSGVETILSGTTERVFYTGAQITYEPNRYGWVQIQTGYRTATDAGHVAGQTENRWLGMLQVGVRIPFGRLRVR